MKDISSAQPRAASSFHGIDISGAGRERTADRNKILYATANLRKGVLGAVGPGAWRFSFGSCPALYSAFCDGCSRDMPSWELLRCRYSEVKMHLHAERCTFVQVQVLLNCHVRRTALDSTTAFGVFSAKPHCTISSQSNQPGAFPFLGHGFEGPPSPLAMLALCSLVQTLRRG